MPPVIPPYSVPDHLRWIEEALNSKQAGARLQEIWTSHDAVTWMDCPCLYLRVGAKFVGQGELLLGHHVLSVGLESIFPKAPPPREGARKPRQVEPEERDPAEVLPVGAGLFVPLCQQKALALAQLGAYEAAWAILRRLYERDPRDGETTGILARTYKDQAFAEPIKVQAHGVDKPGRANLTKAAEIYFGGYRDGRSSGDLEAAYYNGINAAACEYFLGQGEDCRRMAITVIDVLVEIWDKARTKAAGEAGLDGLDAWWLATWGEAHLYLCLTQATKDRELERKILGFPSYAAVVAGQAQDGPSRGVRYGRKEAKAAYVAAAAKSTGQYRELSSMKRQVFRIQSVTAPEKKKIVEEIRGLIKLPDVLSYSAWSQHPGAFCDEDCEDAVARKALCEEMVGHWESALKAEKCVIAYTTLSCCAEILFAEAVLRYRRVQETRLPGQNCAELHVILPFEAEEVEKRLVDHWMTRFRTILGAASSTTTVGRVHDTDLRDHLLAFACPVTHGRARLHAKSLDADHTIIGSTTCQGGGTDGAGVKSSPPTGESVDAKHIRCRVVNSSFLPSDRAATKPTEKDLDRKAAKHLHYLPILFSDIEGYGALSDRDLVDFSGRFTSGVREILAKKTSEETLYRPARTQGDSVMITFRDLQTALDVAVALQNLVREIGEEMRRPLRIRVALDAGPCCSYTDQVTERTEFCGYYVNRAARIEPVTTPGEVFASETFAALWSLEGGESYRLEFVGRKVLPKGHGDVLAWVVRRSGLVREAVGAPGPSRRT